MKKNYVFEYEKNFKKLESTLKKSNYFIYKKLFFDIYPSLKEGKFFGDVIFKDKEKNMVTYELILPTDIKLKYTVDKINKQVLLESIEPTKALYESKENESVTYKGVMKYKEKSDKDMFKINLMRELEDNNVSEKKKVKKCSDEKNSKNTKLFNFIHSLIFVFGYNTYYFRDESLGNRSIFNFILLFLICNLFESNRKNKLKKKKAIFIFSTIFSICLVVGNIMYFSNNISTFYHPINNLFLNIIYIISFIQVFQQIFMAIFNKINLTKDNKKQWKFYKNKHVCLILFVGILLIWMIYYLAYYPGIFSYDSFVQLYQIYGEFTNTSQHPFIHTLFFRICLAFYNRTGIEAILVYSVIQMIIFSFALTNLIKLFIDKKVNNWIIFFSILFFSINPIIGIFSFIMTKDVLFTAFLILFITETVKMIDNPSLYLSKKLNIALYVFYTIMTILFRNNAIYAMTIFIPILIYVLKDYYKQLIILFLIPLVLFMGFNKIVLPMFGVIKGNSAEKLSVPIQQIALSAYNHQSDLTIKDRNEINNFVNYKYMILRYNYRFSDPVKGIFNNKFYEINKDDYLRLWIKYLLKYPDNYVTAFLNLNLPYWYIDAKTIDDFSNREYIETAILKTKYYTIKRESKIPWLYKLLEKNVIHYENYEDVPFLSFLLSISLPIWFVLFCLFILIYRKQYKKSVVLIPFILLYLTYMLGPVSNFRYILPLFTAYPLFLALIYDNKNKLIQNKKSI